MKQTLNRHEKRNQRTAVIVMLAITVPILLIYGSFFKMAFFDEAGHRLHLRVLIPERMVQLHPVQHPDFQFQDARVRHLPAVPVQQ